jgi:hypothetical protein
MSTTRQLINKVDAFRRLKNGDLFFYTKGATL